MKRRFLAYTAVHSGAARGLRMLGRDGIAVLAYHRISGPLSPFDALFDESVYTCSESALDAQLTVLRSLRTIVSVDDLCDAFDGKRALARSSALVTFDDATHDHYSRALPILERHRIPAVFFVSTRSLIERTVEWWNLLGFAVRSCSSGTYDLGRSFGSPVTLSDRASRDRAFAAIARHIKAESTEADARPLVEEIARRLVVPLPTRDEQSRGLLRPEHLREMAARGMFIGSHSHSHSFLRRLTPERQLRELGESKSILESIVTNGVRSVAYPYGQRVDYDERTLAAARDAGYDCGFNMTERRAPFAPPSNRYDIPRFPPPPRADFEFEAALSGIASS
jgi:peptidoglycan/xylan/chitin deacetylase (PgdA/CDA1 family)